MQLSHAQEGLSSRESELDKIRSELQALKFQAREATDLISNAQADSAYWETLVCFTSSQRCAVFRSGDAGGWPARRGSTAHETIAEPAASPTRSRHRDACVEGGAFVSGQRGCSLHTGTHARAYTHERTQARMHARAHARRLRSLYRRRDITTTRRAVRSNRPGSLKGRFLRHVSRQLHSIQCLVKS